VHSGPRWAAAQCTVQAGQQNSHSKHAGRQQDTPPSASTAESCSWAKSGPPCCYATAVSSGAKAGRPREQSSACQQTDPHVSTALNNT
jgi:hypothetical protein